MKTLVQGLWSKVFVQEFFLEEEGKAGLKDGT